MPINNFHPYQKDQNILSWDSKMTDCSLPHYWHTGTVQYSTVQYSTVQPASLLTHRHSVEGADIAVSQTSRQPHVSLLPPLCPPAVLDPPVEAPVHVLGHPIAHHGDGVRVGHFALLEEDVAVFGHHLRAVHTVLRKERELCTGKTAEERERV